MVGLFVRKAQRHVAVGCVAARVALAARGKLRNHRGVSVEWLAVSPNHFITIGAGVRGGRLSGVHVSARGREQAEDAEQVARFLALPTVSKICRDVRGRQGTTRK